MPNVVQKQISMPPNPYLKLEKENNNNIIKKNVNFAGRRVNPTTVNISTAGKKFGNGPVVISKPPNSMNVFERLTQSPKNYRKSESVDRAKSLVARQNTNNMLKNIPIVTLNKISPDDLKTVSPRSKSQPRIANGIRTSLLSRLLAKQNKKAQDKEQEQEPTQLQIFQRGRKKSDLTRYVTRKQKLHEIELMQDSLKTVALPNVQVKKIPVSPRAAANQYAKATAKKILDQKEELTKATNNFSQNIGRLKPQNRTTPNIAQNMNKFKKVVAPAPSPLASPTDQSPRYQKLKRLQKLVESSSVKSLTAEVTNTSLGLTSELLFDPTNKLSDRTLSTKGQSDMSIDSNIITENVHDILQKKNAHISESDLYVLKNVVKSDRRAVNLKTQDSIVFKDILTTQLKDILKQELVVATTLGNLDNTVATKKTLSSLLSKPACSHIKNKPKDEIYDYIEQLPLLEKEIFLLRTLGERLENKLTDKSGDKISVSTSVSDLKNSLCRIWNLKICLPEPLHAGILARSVGIRYEFGHIREFCIAIKTLHELKQETDRKFYVSEDSELKCVNLDELQQNPIALKRYLHPKNHVQKFNVLDQDPFLFANDIINTTQTSKNQMERRKTSNDKDYYYVKAFEPFNNNSQSVGMDNSGGYLKNKNLCLIFDCHQQQLLENKTFLSESPAGLKVINQSMFEGHQADLSKEQMEDVTSRLISSFNEQQAAASAPPTTPRRVEDQTLIKESKAENEQQQNVQVRKTRHKNQRKVAPLRLNEERVGPKNNLVRIAIMASVQLAMLFIVVAAFAFPDWTCK